MTYEEMTKGLKAIQKDCACRLDWDKVKVCKKNLFSLAEVWNNICKNEDCVEEIKHYKPRAVAFRVSKALDILDGNMFNGIYVCEEEGLNVSFWVEIDNTITYKLNSDNILYSKLRYSCGYLGNSNKCTDVINFCVTALTELILRHIAMKTTDDFREYLKTKGRTTSIDSLTDEDMIIVKKLGLINELEQYNFDERGNKIVDKAEEQAKRKEAYIKDMMFTKYGLTDIDTNTYYCIVNSIKGRQAFDNELLNGKSVINILANEFKVPVHSATQEWFDQHKFSVSFDGDNVVIVCKDGEITENGNKSLVDICSRVFDLEG
jgi:hypothetical protein